MKEKKRAIYIERRGRNTSRKARECSRDRRQPVWEALGTLQLSAKPQSLPSRLPSLLLWSNSAFPNQPIRTHIPHAFISRSSALLRRRITHWFCFARFSHLPFFLFCFFEMIYLFIYFYARSVQAVYLICNYLYVVWKWSWKFIRYANFFFTSYSQISSSNYQIPIM